ncbi:major facilitator superfamily domain-containing protein [Phlyctochytrium arcticum]|nr:major facilitator superfamily domain-containing protein [Phlyctochytrium arcticum]
MSRPPRSSSAAGNNGEGSSRPPRAVASRGALDTRNESGSGTLGSELGFLPPPLRTSLSNLEGGNVISRGRSRNPIRRVSLASAVTISPSALTRGWMSKPTPFRRARTEAALLPPSLNRSTSSYTEFPPSLQRSETSMSSVNSLRGRNRGAWMRRMSSFGGAPIYLPPPILPPGLAEEEEPPNPHLRWAILMLTCTLLFGNYYAYDNPAALNKPLQEYLGHDYDSWQYELNLLYSVYSFPNMFLPFLGGQLVDRLDVKKVLIFFSAIVCMGQTLFAVGVSLKSFPIMLLGRVLFGIGGESIGVVQASITTAWFRGKELAFALGLNLCIARFGSVVNANLSPRIEKIWTSSGAVWVGAGTCYTSFCCALVLAALMATHSPDGSKPKSPSSSRSSASEQRPLLEEQNTPDNANRPLLPSKSGNLTDEPDSYTNDATVIDDEIEPWSFKQSLREIALFPGEFWIVCVICVMLYGTVVPFNNIASDFLMSKWYPGDTQTAGTVMSIPDTMSAILVPPCGLLVDRYGGRASLLLICALVIAAVHATLGFTMLTPIVPLLFLGLSYSMYGVTIWPSIATIIQHRELELEHDPEHGDVKLLGTAYGLSTSALNTALTIMPLISAQIRVWSEDFKYVELFFVCLALGGACASAVLWVVDVRYGDGLLQMPEHDPEDEFESISPEASHPEGPGRPVNVDSSNYGALANQNDIGDVIVDSLPPDKAPRKRPKSPVKYGKAFGSKLKNRGRLDSFLESCESLNSTDNLAEEEGHES